MSVYQWLCVAGIPSVITLIITRVITKRLNAAENKAEVAQKRSDAIALGIQALLRDRLLQGYRHYQEKAGPTMMTGPIWKMSGVSTMPWVGTGI